MKESIMNTLPSLLQGETGGLNVIGWTALLGVSTVLFLLIGLILGNVFFRRGREAVLEFHEENQRGIVRVENYRATIDKQMRSEQRLEG